MVGAPTGGHIKDWGRVAEEVGRRQNECSHRWLNFLCPLIEDAPWDLEEEQWLLCYFASFGYYQWNTVVECVRRKSSGDKYRSSEQMRAKLDALLDNKPSQIAANRLWTRRNSSQGKPKMEEKTQEGGKPEKEEREKKKGKPGVEDKIRRKRQARKLVSRTERVAAQGEGVTGPLSLIGELYGSGEDAELDNSGEGLARILNCYEEVESISVMVKRVWSDDPALQLEATTQFRNLWSIDRIPPIDAVREAGVVPKFVEFLGRHEMPELQFEAAGALINVASGTSEHIKLVIDHNAVPMFVQLLSSARDDVKEQAVLALGIVASDSPTCRDLVLAQGALMPLMALVSEKSKLSMLRKATRTLSHFCRDAPFEKEMMEAQIIHPLAQLLQHAEYNIRKEAAWAISKAISGGSHEQILFLVTEGCIKPLCDLLICSDPRIVTVCLEVLEDILIVGEADKKMGIDNGINLFAEMIDECDGLVKIENLQTHYNHEIYEKAVKILETFWIVEDEDKGQNLGGKQPTIPPGG